MRTSDLHQKLLTEFVSVKENVDVAKVQIETLSKKFDNLEKRVNDLEGKVTSLETKLESVLTALDFVKAELSKISQQLWGDGNPEKGLVYIGVEQKSKKELWQNVFVSGISAVVGGAVSLVGYALLGILI